MVEKIIKKYYNLDIKTDEDMIYMNNYLRELLVGVK